MKPLKFGSLFAGIGGIDLGLERAGMECIFQVEKEAFPNRVLSKHWPKVEKINDIKQFNPRKKHRCDVIAGGFPCQDISNAANNRKGLEGDRSGLWWEMLRIIEETKPSFVVIENVSSLRKRGLEQVLRSIAEIGFDAEWTIFRASDFGFAHKRERMFIVAYSNRVDWFDGGHHERFDGVGARCEFNSSARSCKDGGDVLRWLVQAYKAFNWSAHHPGTGRKIDGIPNRVDRLRGLGNAVVPDIAEFIGRRIVSIARYTKKVNRGD